MKFFKLFCQLPFDEKVVVACVIVFVGCHVVDFIWDFIHLIVTGQ